MKILSILIVSLGFFLNSAPLVAACSEASITANDTKSGTLGSSDCAISSLIGGSDTSKVDVYNLEVSSETTLSIEMASTAFDSFLRVYNSDYTTKVEEDDDSGSQMDAKITDLTLVAGSYHILANSSTQATELGAYTLTTTSNSNAIETIIVSALLPTSRSVKVGTSASAFATVINGGTVTASSCGLSLASPIDASFSYQTTDPATNASIGSANTPVSIEPGKFQTYIFTITPNSAFPPQEVEINYSCSNSANATTVIGLNTLLLSASDTPVADIVALVATTEPGVVSLPDITGEKFAVFSVASVNVGSTDNLTVSVDIGSATYDYFVLMCQTNPATAACVNPTVASTNPIEVTVSAGETPTFAFFVAGKEQIAFDPAGNRMFVRFKDQTNATRGATSVAIRTKP